MKKYILLAIILLCGLTLIGLNWMQGSITANEFSHDLELLNYDGWQYTLKQPANYRSFKELEWRLWYEVYDQSNPPNLLKSSRPEKAWIKSTDSISRNLPVDIVLNRISEANNYYWEYRALLAFSGVSGRIKEATIIDKAYYGGGFSLPHKIVYEENTPIQLGEMTINMGPQDKSRMIRWYLEFGYSNHKTAEQAGPGYPPQGVGSPEP